MTKVWPKATDYPQWLMVVESKHPNYDNCPYCGQHKGAAEVVAEDGWYERRVIYRCATCGKVWKC
jgi:uncharacterized Zn finger protein